MFITRKDLQFLPKEGFYHSASNRCYNAPGFSAIMRHGEEDWTKTYDKTKLKKAVARGKGFDDAVQAYYDELAYCDLENKPLLQSAMPFLDQIQPIAQEIFVFGKICELPVLGFIDAIANVPDKGLTLIDWKTKASSNFNPLPLERYLLQISVYAILVQMYYDIVIEQSCIFIAFASGEPHKIIWLDRQDMLDRLTTFFTKAHRYKQDKAIAWRGEYSL